jgi:hypothetical protein
VGVRSSLSSLASRARIPVFALPGEGAWEAVQDLRLSERLRLTKSPRSANVLLVAGRIPEWARAAVVSAHDSMAHPRATVFWARGGVADDLAVLFGEAIVTDDHPAEAIAGVHGDMLAGVRSSDSPVLLDVEPAPWRGVGPYGQGGLGMTGGVPYGRPLADRAEDRDGLTLDQLPLRVGPFLSPLPPGLALDVKVQGDVIQDVEFVASLGKSEPRTSDRRPDDPFMRALETAVPISEIELARASSHLRWLSDALLAQGLDALSHRALALAVRLGSQDAEAVRRFLKSLARTGVLFWSTGVGVIRRDQIGRSSAGPVTRAAGLPDDARSDDPAYRALGFEPIVEEGADVAARWRQRLAEILQSIELSARAGARSTSTTEQVESPRGRLRAGSRPSRRLLELVPQLIEGAEWGDAVVTIASLDLDPDDIWASAQHDVERAR